MPAIAAPPAAAPPSAGSPPPSSQSAPPSGSPPPAARAEPEVDLYDAAGEIEALDNGAPAPGSRPPPKIEDGRGENPPGEPGGEEPREGAGEKQPKTHDEEIDEIDAAERAKDGKPEVKPAKEGEKPEEKPQRAKDLKIHYEKLKTEHAALAAKHQEATAELERVRTANPDEVKALKTQLEAAEARRNELESRLQHVDFTQSEEYQTKYEKPLTEAWQRAASDLAEITIENADGSSRPATAQDLAELANMPIKDAWTRAQELFGPVAGEIMAHRRKVIDLSRLQNEALAKSRKEAGERSKLREVESRERAEKMTEIYNATGKEMVTKWPRMFGEIPGDDEGNAILRKGFEEVDRLYQDQNLPPEERVKLSVRIRHKAANHDRLALRIRKLSETLKKTKAELAEFQATEPPGGKTGRRPAGSGNGSTNPWDAADAEIDAMDQK